MWKKIIQDDFVNFEKLYAILGNSNIEFEDDGRDFGRGYVLVRKDYIVSTKRAFRPQVRAESEENGRISIRDV